MGVLLHTCTGSAGAGTPWPVKDFDATGRLYRMAGAGSIHEAQV